MSEIIGATAEEIPSQEEAAVVERKFAVELIFTTEGVKINVSSNLTALEQLGAIEIFKAHLLASSLGDSK
jgi:hypothetical protein